MEYLLTVRKSRGLRDERERISADSQREALAMVAQFGWRVISIDGEKNADKPRERSIVFPLLQFSQELLALLEAGLNVHEGLVALRRKEGRAAIAKILDEVLQHVKNGSSFSEALSKIPVAFPDVYVATIQASERSGDLAEALQRFIDYQSQLDIIRKKLLTAAVYPAVLFSVGILVTLFLIGYVVPRFSAVYESAGRDIPALSAMLLAVGQSIGQHTIVFALLAATGGAAIGYVILSRNARARVLSLLTRIPALQKRVSEFRLARFYWAMSLLLHAGIPLPKAMGMGGALLLLAQRVRLQKALQDLHAGVSFSQILNQNELATPIAQSLLQVGEKTGRLGEMLERSARFHDEEFSRWIEVMSRLLEPVLMAVIGVVIGGVVVLMYIPVFDLAGALQ